MTRTRLGRIGGVGRLTLARPEKKNALDRRMADEIVQGLEQLTADPETRVIVIEGEGDDFCAGADLEALEALIDAPHDVQLDDARAFGRVFTTIRRLRVPVIAAVRGRALAGGAGLATACDMVLAHPNAQFAYPEVRIGFVPAMVMTMLCRTVGVMRAFDLAVTGRTISASEAASIGLVSRVLPADGFADAVDEVCQSIAKSPPDAVRRTKKLLYELDDMPFDSALGHGAVANAEARTTEEFRHGVRTFLQRRRGT